MSPEGTAEGVTTTPLHLFRPFNPSPLSQRPPLLPPLLLACFALSNLHASNGSLRQAEFRRCSPAIAVPSSDRAFLELWLGLELRSGPAAGAAGDWERTRFDRRTTSPTHWSKGLAGRVLMRVLTMGHGFALLDRARGTEGKLKDTTGRCNELCQKGALRFFRLLSEQSAEKKKDKCRCSGDRRNG